MRTTLLLALLALSTMGAAQDYPTKPITMVVPFPPGGVAEIVGRPLAAIMEKSLKQPIVLINRPGAGGAVGMASVAKGVGASRLVAVLFFYRAFARSDEK